MSAAYYNEIDQKKAAWLRELIKAGAIAPGDVDERSISDVQPADLLGYTRCHFFAGIGIWDYALRLAGWPDDRPVWTGSCPCPSFSAAGKGQGFDDPRHLWPAWNRLIRECRPPVVFGEQVDAAIGHGWFDLVQTDLEAEGYAVGKAVLGACSVGAPHRRQRLYFVAESGSDGHGRAKRLATIPRRDESGIGLPVGDCNAQFLAESQDRGRRSGQPHDDARESDAQGSFCVGLLAHSDGRDASAEREQRGGEQRQQPQDGGVVRVADASSGLFPLAQRGPQGGDGTGPDGPHNSIGPRRPGPLNGFWRDADWLRCRDGKWRPVEAGTFPLAHGSAGRVGRLRGYGDGIVAQAAAAFVTAFMEAKL